MASSLFRYTASVTRTKPSLMPAARATVCREEARARGQDVMEDVVEEEEVGVGEGGLEAGLASTIFR